MNFSNKVLQKCLTTTKYSNQSDDFYERPAIGRFFFFPKGAFIHHLQSRRWYLSRWLESCAPHELSFRQFSRGAGNVASEHSLCSRLYILQYQQNDEVAYCHPIPPPVCENLLLAAFTQLWISHFRRHPFSLFKRETERKDGENKWQFIIWKQK